MRLLRSKKKKNKEVEENTRKTPKKTVPRQNRLVLVVEDEPIMRKIAVRVLKDAGYDVIIAEDGELGIQRYREHHENIVLVLLDMVLPKKSGEEVYRELKKINPAVKVLLNSGFSNDQRVKDALKLGKMYFLEKPYSLEALSEAVHKAIAGD